MNRKTNSCKLVLNLSMGLTLFALFLLAFPAQPARAGTVRYAIPSGSTTDASCSTWGTACTLTRTLAVAAAGDEIWVKAGVHKPGSTQGSYFLLKTGVAVYGGFAGTESSRGDRNWQTNVTVLSGDVDSNDTVDANGIVTDTTGIHGTNAYHVVRGTVDNTAILDGFYITAGVANSGTGCANGCGGGLYLYTGSGTLANLVFSGNKAATGAGLALWTSNPTLTNVTFVGNVVTGAGGALYANGSSPSFAQVTFDQNTAATYGGAIYSYGGNLTFDQATLSHNTAAAMGGGLYAYSSNVTMTDSLISANTTLGASISGTGYSWGGGLYIGNSTLSTLTRVNVDSNQSKSDPVVKNYSYGGGLYLNASNVTLTDSNVTNNSAPVPGYTVGSPPASQGGGILVYRGNVEITRVTVSGNSAVIGGGIYNFYNTALTLTNVSLISNTAWDSGAGFLNYQASPTFRNVIFKDNAAASNNEQALPSCLADPTDPNYCGGNAGGGGIYNYDGSSPVLENVTFTGNSGGIGGAIYNDKNSSPILRNVTIAQNTAAGTDILDASGNPTGSRTAGFGAGVYNVMGSQPTIVNCLLWGNTNTGSSSTAPIYSATTDYVGAADTSSTTVTYSSVQGGFAGAGNVNSDPLLGPLGTYGGLIEVLPLLPGSPAIDAASDAAGNCSTTDQRGVARPQGAHCDMGAFESRGFTLAKTGGDGQTAIVSTAFPAPLTVSVVGSNGEPVNGGLVTFSAPTSGASATFGTDPVTIAAGQASTTVQANDQAGAYTIQAATGGASPVSFGLTNSPSTPMVPRLYLPMVRR